MQSCRWCGGDHAGNALSGSAMTSNRPGTSVSSVYINTWDEFRHRQNRLDNLLFFNFSSVAVCKSPPRFGTCCVRGSGCATWSVRPNTCKSFVRLCWCGHSHSISRFWFLEQLVVGKMHRCEGLQLNLYVLERPWSLRATSVAACALLLCWPWESSIWPLANLATFADSERIYLVRFRIVL